MYQVSWASFEEDRDSDPVDNYDFVETWAEVKDWMHIVSQDPDVHHWVVSMVTESSDENLRSINFSETNEKSAYMYNINMLLPQNMSEMEVFATLMNVASRYWSQEEMVQGFLNCAKAANSMPDDSSGGMMH